MQDMEQRIRERAYHLWNDAGRPEGDADAFWLSAQREILTESLSQVANVKSKEPKKTTKPKVPSPRKRKAA
jgi:hypothetical protein